MALSVGELRDRTAPEPAADSGEETGGGAHQRRVTTIWNSDRNSPDACVRTAVLVE